jgi:hypothetical protein
MGWSAAGLPVIRPESRICSVTNFSEAASGAPRRFHLSGQRIIVYLKAKGAVQTPQDYNHCHSWASLPGQDSARMKSSHR